MLVRACGLALRALPNVNRSWIDGRLVRHADVSVGIAVALDQEELIVPVIRHADQKTLSDLSAESRELAERARNGALRPGELEAATFTVTNLGMFGIDEFHAIINPPESGILAAGAVTDRPAVVDGEVVATKAIRLSLSADHRVYSGATGATFIKTIAGYLEKPLSLCL
jgi:pyruvate dehydrogenase E2 component (dihydrolipoamide acetyltransferase)